jgi:hypothetical protein
MIPVLQPKQVQCIKKEAGSFVYECIYDVYGCIFNDNTNGRVIFRSGNLSTIKWDDINFFKPIYTDEELLDFAKKMYPIGTKYKCEEGEILKSFRNPVITFDGNIDAKPGYIYYKKTNTWAEIISEPEKFAVKYAKELAEVERLFPEGTNGRTKSWTNPSGYISVKRNGKLLFDEYDNHVRITSEQRTGILWSTKYGYSIPDNKKQPKVGDWIKLIDKPIDGKRPNNWISNMDIFYGTWQKVIKIDYNHIPCISAPNASGNWIIEHCNYTDVKTHEEYMKDVAYVYETVLPPDFTKNLCSEVTMPRTDIENVKVTDEEYKKAKPYNNAGALKHTFKPFEDAHNKAYDQLISEGQVLIDGGLIKPEWVSRPLTPYECYPATPDGWMPTDSFTKSAANLVATKLVKVTGYKYVNLKNK